jgi:RNA polymerase sigma factor (sigma-70 family)
MRDFATAQPPHHHHASWGGLLDSLDVASIFVVLSSWIHPRLRRHVAVEDIWQDTLCMAWQCRHQHEWRGLTAYRAWLLAIARNRIRDALRSACRQKRGGDAATHPLSALAGDGASLPAGSTTPSRIATHRERSRVMRKALADLEPELQIVVRLRLFEELSMRVVAGRLNLPLSTAKARLLRGVARYRSNLNALLRGDSVIKATQL